MVNEIEETSLGYLLSPEFELINSAGKPLTGGWIEVYIHGTRNKYYCYSDWSGNLHPFQIPLDSLGANIVLASPAHSYDIYVYNKFGTLVMSRYNVLPQIAGTAVISGSVNIESSDGTVNIEVTGDNNFDISIADIIDSVTANIDESITNIEGDITEINQEITNITNVVTGLPTHADVYDSIVTGIEYVTGMIPEAQVQSDWDETDPTDPAYILNKPDLDNYVTIDELTEAISGVTGLNLEYGQFYCQTTTGGAVMGRTKGNIEVDNTGKIKLKKGQSYHVTVRGGYSKATASADYGVLSYIEYITGQNINVNVDNSVTDTQYFEISYDLYKLSSDKNYYVFFSLPTGSSVNNLFIEIHSIGCMGTGGSGSGVPVEYDAGWGINIIDNVISVDPSILNQYVTQEELVSAISGLAPEYTAGDNIEIDNDVISVSNPATFVGESDTGYISVGNITHWNEFTEAPGIVLKSHTSSVYPGGETNFEWHVTPDHAHQVMAWGDYDVDYDTNTVSATKYMTIGEGDIKYQQGAFQDTNTLPVIWSCSQMAQDISELQEAITAVSGSFVQEQSDWAEQDSTKVDYIKNKPVEKQLIAGDNIVITESVTGVVISASGSTYTAGNGIDITNDTISIDNTVALKSDIPDVSNFATETELQDGLELVTGLIPDTDNLATKAELQDNIELVTGLIPAAQVNSDWDANSGVAQILNKPTEKELVAGTNITITESATGIIIDAAGGGSGGDSMVIIDVSTGTIDWQSVYTTINSNWGTCPIYLKAKHFYNGSYNDMFYHVNAREPYSTDPSETGYKYHALAINPVDNLYNCQIFRGECYYTSTGNTYDGSLMSTDVGTTPPAEWWDTGKVLCVNAAGYPEWQTPQGGSSYTAGNGIDITNDVISVDNTVALKTDIPVVSGLATKEELQDGLELVTGLIPTDYATDAELQDGLELVTGMIPNYTAGDGIDITNDEISAKLGANMSFDNNDAITVDLTGVAEDAAGLVSGNIPQMELIAGNRIQIATSGVSAVINAVIPDAAKDAILANSYDNPGWETTGTVTTYNPLGLAIHPDLAYDSYNINASRLSIKEIGSGMFYLDLFISMTGTPKAEYGSYQNYITLTNGHFVCPTNSNVYDEWNSCFGSIHQDTLYGTGLDFNSTKPYDATRKHYVQLHTLVANW